MSSADSRNGLDSTNPLNPTNLFDVEGLVAVVTGGGTGIGLQIAKALENNGATVYIVGRRLGVLEEAAREHSRYKRLLPYQTDITSLPSLLDLTAHIKASHGYIDLLVNNAGIVRGFYPKLPGPGDDYGSGSGQLAVNENGIPSVTHSPASVPPPSSSSQLSIQAFQQALWSTSSPEDFAQTFATNVTAHYYTTVAFLELLHAGNLRKQRSQDRDGSSPLIVPNTPSPSSSLPPHSMSGPTLQPPPVYSSHVITISSSGAFRIDAGVVSPSYTVAKCAATHLGCMLANMLAPWGIRSNVLAPGVWPSEMTQTDTLTPEMMARTVPLRRPGNQGDMAGVILFLASRAGAYVNGDVWLVDGGRVAGLPNNYGSFRT